jgi:hypothetical protein
LDRLCCESHTATFDPHHPRIYDDVEKWSCSLGGCALKHQASQWKTRHGASRPTGTRTDRLTGPYSRHHVPHLAELRKPVFGLCFPSYLSTYLFHTFWSAFASMYSTAAHTTRSILEWLLSSKITEVLIGSALRGGCHHTGIALFSQKPPRPGQL